jgi:hypothetical protein
MMFFVGDVHGKIAEFEALIRRRVPPLSSVFQLGDMGIGFSGVVLDPTRLADWQVRFIRGNHDNPARCRQHPLYAGEFGTEDALFWCGGAWSIDHEYRKSWMAHYGRECWWPDEELSEEQLEAALKVYSAAKPRIVATHECPRSAVPIVLSCGFRPEKAECADTRTSQWFERMLAAHAPEHWVFGHYHRDFDFRVEGCDTRFHCLNELSLLELDTTRPSEAA